jgi:ATP-dependent DNA ligase
MCFPQIAEAISKLKVRSCFIDGEAVVVDERGLSGGTVDLTVSNFS